MNPQPYLFYSVVKLIDGSGPFFLDKDESFDGRYCSLYKLDDIVLGGIEIDTIWYDFEKETFFKSVIELDPLQPYGCIYLMLMLGGGIIAWISNSSSCEAILQWRSELVSIDAINPDWEAERDKLQQSFNQNRDKYSQDISHMLKAIKQRMKKYYFRYNFMVRGDKELDLTLFKELLIDGSMHQLDDDSMLNYYERACPMKLELGWSIGDDSYSAYIFMHETELLGTLNRFYGTHADTKSDYIFNIDVDANEYSIALYRQGLKEPVIIPESAYQMIVFKNKFEYYRSENYDQPCGAWIW